MSENKTNNNTCICFFNTAKVWGGGEKWHFEHAKALQNQGFKVIAVTSPNSDLHQKLMRASIPVFSLKINTLSFLNPFKRRELINFFKRNKVSKIIINLSADLKIAAPTARKAGVAKIIYRRGSSIPIKSTPLNRNLLLKKTDLIIANSQATKKTVQQHINVPDSKIKIIYNGVHTQNLQPQPKTNRPLVIGGLGRLNKQKAFHLFIDTLEELHKRGLKVKAEIGGKGELEEYLKNYAEQKNLTNYINFSGFQTDINQFMSRIDIFFLSSEWEGFGYVLAEAAACEKPCVGFNISSNPELILHEKTGFLAPAFNISKAADYLTILIENKALREKMGQNGRKHILKNFTFKHSIELIKEL